MELSTPKDSLEGIVCTLSRALLLQAVLGLIALGCLLSIEAEKEDCGSMSITPDILRSATRAYPPCVSASVRQACKVRFCGSVS